MMYLQQKRGPKSSETNKTPDLNIRDTRVGLWSLRLACGAHGDEVRLTENHLHSGPAIPPRLYGMTFWVSYCLTLLIYSWKTLVTPNFMFI